MDFYKIFLSVIVVFTTMTGCSRVEQNSDSETLNNVSHEITAGLEVHFIDVGQADAALIRCGEESMLIDGGNAEDSNIIYTYLKKYEISELDYIVASHAHEDHIGGLAGALNYASAKNALCPVKYYDSRAFKNFVKYLASSGDGTEITIPSPGDSFTLGDAQVDILGCNGAENTNDSSVILKITYDETSFLFTGDAERAAEQAVLDFCAESEYDLSSTVLKVGHHGSDSSTTYPFLREIMPEYAVISVGKDNSYGHPSDDTLSRLYDAGAQVYRTDLCGDIIFRSDGKEIAVETAENQSADKQLYILNTSTKKYHREWCKNVDDIKDKNKQIFRGSAKELEESGYSPCGSCGKSDVQ